MSFLVSVLLIWLVAVISPGPNLFLVLRYSLIGQRPQALAAAAGIASGTMVWGLAGLLGIVSLFVTFPQLFLFLKLAGAAYLAFTGLKMLRAAWRNDYSPATAEAPKTKASPRRAYGAGVVTNLSNPKTAIFVSALFAAAMPESLPLPYGLLGVGVMASVSIVWYSLVAFLFTTQRVSKMAHRIRRWIDGIAGLAFLLFAGRLVLDRR
ncbi:LysE family translocator [uncultured Cohaesibacter sp.]|uniref:LysE family translocator n=1 Tax=uncultured Cohaesibacter sp. TaxID=1002546 RepID=UPI00292EF58C|nr:LysE family translocator [uncultured Cohaesibacter sp.]